jgi:tryptophanyl-tRNA synthetase
MRKKLVSGIQPTGQLHIGNYFGALRQFVELQDKYESKIFIADYHALTTIQNKELLQKNILNVATDYLALGLDPEKTTLYQQSQVPQVTELTWIFDTLVTVPYLSRAHSYKDKVAKGIEATVGLFNYPVLMASDILITNPDVVPVGQDQKQHIEMARDIAEKFNAIYGSLFNLPKELVLEDVATIPGIDGQKMSKSYGNTIPLFATEVEIETAVMSIPTDSKGVAEPKQPEGDTVFEMHKLFSTHELDEIRDGYEKGGLSYVDSKKKLIRNMNTLIEPLREKRVTISKDLDFVRYVLSKGSEKARLDAEKMMQQVREMTGLRGQSNRFKPATLYHGSTKKIEGPLKPILQKKTGDHTHTKSAVFATERKDIAALFMVPIDGVLASIGLEKDISYICIWGTSKEFALKDKGAYIYTLPSNTFEKIGKGYEWQSFTQVTPVNTEYFESVLTGLLVCGVRIYFINDEKIFDKIVANKNSRLTLLKDIEPYAADEREE